MSTAITDAIPDLDGLVREVEARSTRAHGIHGPQHWRAVARVGAELIEAGEAAHPAVVFLFGLLHDSQRLDDGHDPEHGPRAATLARELAGTWLHLSDDELERLCEACARHTAGARSDDPTVGVCWDADRLNLARVGIHPSAAYLSTASAREPERIASCSSRCHEGADWRALFERFDALETRAMYHGTRLAAEAGIRNGGIREGLGRLQGVTGVYLTPNREIAWDYASYQTQAVNTQRGAAHLESLVRGGGLHDPEFMRAERDKLIAHERAGLEDGLILTVRVPASAVFLISEDDHFGHAINVPVIPPALIEKYERVPFERARSLAVGSQPNPLFGVDAYTSLQHRSFERRRDRGHFTEAGAYHRGEPNDCERCKAQPQRGSVVSFSFGAWGV